MARADLLALEAEDLAVLSNRGIVKRAQAELDSGDFTADVSEEGGAVTVKWSDDIECVIPAGKGLADGLCSCPATTLCRHLVRSVLAYQRQARTPGDGDPPAGAPEAIDAAPPLTTHHSPLTLSREGEAPAEPPPANEAHPPPTPHHSPLTHSREPWDPGVIPDEELERRFRKADLLRARRQFEEGHVVELLRGVKPSAYLHTVSLNVRFMVPGDLSYTHCDCAEPRPCSHVPLAVWAFRLLPPERSGGVVATRTEAYPVPGELLERIENALLELALTGVQGAPRTLIDRFRRLDEESRAAGLVWPAEILWELVHQHDAYAAHDARFSPRRVAELVGELCVRMDAVRADTGAVPQLFIRGSRTDRTTDVGKAQMVGLGCGVRIGRGSIELTAYFQDDRSGSVVAVSRDFPDPAPEAPEQPKDFPALAGAPVMKGISLAALGAGRLHVEGGKRTPSCRYVPGRARASLNPHTLQWEKLVRAPVMADDFSELAARLAAQPPSSLSPRRVGSRLHVCPIGGVEGVFFSEPDQMIYALLQDAAGATALLAHPYTSRGREGAELLLARLNREPDALRFIAAEVFPGASGLMLRPISLVFEVDGTRSLLQPWVDSIPHSPIPPFSHSPNAQPSHSPAGSGSDPVTHYPGELLDAAGEQWLLGFHRADERAARTWRQLCERGGALGFNRLMGPAERIAAEMETRAGTLRWDPHPAAAALLDLGVIASLAKEQAP